MAKSPKPAEEKESASESKEAQAKPAPKQKLLLYGGAVFIVQVVIIYFVVVKFILPAGPHQDVAAAAAKATGRVAKNGQSSSFISVTVA